MMKIKNTFIISIYMFLAFAFVSCSDSRGSDFIVEYSKVVNEWDVKVKDTLTVEEAKELKLKLNEFKNRGSELKENKYFDNEQNEEFNKLHMRFVKIFNNIKTMPDSLKK